MRNLIENDTCTGQETVIALLRHGKTLWNEEKRIQGRKDSPLSANGRRQVHQWGEFLSKVSIDRIVSSDLGRVKETVSILQQYINSVPVEYSPAFREQSWGEWEEKTFLWLQQNKAAELAAQVAAGWDFRPPGGESRREVLQRALPAVENVVDRFPGEQVLLVSHEGIVKCLLYHLTGRAFLPDEKKLIAKRQLHLLCSVGGKLFPGPFNIFPE